MIMNNTYLIKKIVTSLFLFKLGLFNMAKPNRTELNRTEIDNMVWIWYIPYKPNGYDFKKTVGFGYGSVYNR